MLDDRSPASVASYRERALNVLQHVEDALTEAGRSFDDVQQWLDFGSGYGRVVRFLVERVPSGRVTVSDILEEAVDFCSAEFGVQPLYSTPRPHARELGTYDFIYAISVLSHMNERNSKHLLDLFGRSLAPGGIVLFTTHGQWSLEQPETYGDEYVTRRDEIRHNTERHGAFFLPYPYMRGDHYGMAWHTKEYVERTMRDLHGSELELLRFVPHGLDGHQDVFAFRRRAATAEVSRQAQ
jgi:SAM-dependent methyltransferase